jgi:putative membrane protein
VAHPAASPAPPAGDLTGPAVDALVWAARPEVLAPLALLGGVYAIGWCRLRRRDPRAVSRGRLARGGGALLAIGVALLSPIDRLAGASLAAHMVQHALLITVAAPLWLLADPLPVLLWSLPRAIRLRAGRLVTAASPVRRVGRLLTAPALAWVLHVGVLWAWHAPVAYDAALDDRLLHDLEHLAFLGTALLFWWPLIDPAPRWRAPAPAPVRVVYLVLAVFQGGLLGLLLMLSPGVVYETYAAAPRPWGLDPLADQVLGGLIMWGLIGAIEMLLVLILVSRVLSTPPRPTAAAGPGSSAHAPEPPLRAAAWPPRS